MAAHSPLAAARQRSDSALRHWQALSFIQRRPRSQPRRFWAVPPARDYHAACLHGRQMADELLDYLRQHPQMIGSNRLGHIAADIDFSVSGADKGYWVGFFSRLETLLLREAV
ncbi:hypothetical protein [Parachitinimonas caeni]|uniref:Uncharacterized protein n=1 Tax=Parachitinimonas caeni TaxID=3031301 RepID=A0ABT7E175_9NEIS|nr:hypothetical protein [Parachitinimonas caeni]MDK2126046.1 hypothetical protein [Parachitinimonas caeni]